MAEPGGIDRREQVSAQNESPLEHSFNVVLPPSPYPGLRPFDKDEWAIFFGREDAGFFEHDRCPRLKRAWYYLRQFRQRS